MKFVKKLLSFVLMATLMTTMAFSSIAYAMPQAEPTVENTGAIEQRSLIIHNNYYWNSTNDIQFHVTYVVNDGTSRLVDIKDAYVSNKSKYVYTYTNVKTYIASNGSYATVSCDYTLRGDNTTQTAVVTIYPY